MHRHGGVHGRTGRFISETSEYFTATALFTEHLRMNSRNLSKMQNASHACRICLVRHGETAWNAERRLQGQLDIPLNETGLAQAAATAVRLKALGLDFSALYVSDLQRTRQTAEAISRLHALDGRPEPRLRERHYGIFQGLTYAEAEQHHPELYRRFAARDPEFAFAGHGESLIAFAARTSAALNEIAARHAGQAVLAVTHGGVLDIAHRLTSGAALNAPRDFPIPNAALIWIERTDGTWHLLAWADESHLGEALDELPNA
jgi:probable phosphoglycerate mutase